MVARHSTTIPLLPVTRHSSGIKTPSLNHQKKGGKEAGSVWVRRTIISVDTRLAEWRGKGWYSVVGPQTLARRGRVREGRWERKDRDASVGVLRPSCLHRGARVTEVDMLLIGLHG
ncbi:hypothetical protein E2C01_017083 [Portunus trituberculatus]|uniref:Uncharacterized protein n=1 Tax=Portunus trituberculatus TaxID=210409 RepID=A0A5B7DSN5_PORTR|nr:hypothetical protein [Portunus trituberculatus]